MNSSLRHLLSASALSAALLAATATAPLQAQITAYSEGNGISAVDKDGKLLSVTFVTWGPSWAYTSPKGEIVADGEVGRGSFKGQMGGTKVPFSLQTEFSRPDPRTMRLRYELEAEQETGVTLSVVAFSIADRFQGGKAFATSGGKEAPVTLPLGRAGIGKQVSQVRLVDAQGKEMVIGLNPPVDIASDGDARIVLAASTLPGGEKRAVEMTVKAPDDITWYASPVQLPPPEHWEKWFAWAGDGSIPSDSALSMANWLEAPAGKHGRITSKGSQLIYNGKPAVFWGLNVCYAATAPEKDLADRRAQFYADHGINSVRLHKYADGAGWAGIRSKESFTELDTAGLDRMDYFIAKLKEKGIFVKLSPTFGTFKLGPADAAKVPYIGEFGKADKAGDVGTPHGAAYISTELRDLQIEQMIKLMKHKNPYTGLTYAEDPAVMVVELLNEQSILFFGTVEAMKKSPTLRKRTAERFTDWLLKRYGSKEAVLARWGEGGLNTADGFKDESFEAKSIVPAGNPWFYDPTQLDGPLKTRKPRYLDTMTFLYEVQNEFYATYIKALREAGYKGEIVASNWQAGRAMSHFYNLHSDALAGIVDRHNYFGGKVPMVSRPGSGSLSAGMQQVADRPFMLSEWIHTFPTEYQVEGPALIGAYGMGLQGWDVSYIFQNKDNAGYDKNLGETWHVMQPQIIGVFPAVARQVLRGDVKESDVVVKRSVHIPSLHEGKLGFDDQMKQGYDEKSFDSKTVPVGALAAVRSVVSFDDSFKETPAFDLSPYIKDGAIVSSNGQLSWIGGKSRDEGFFTMNTPGTKAVVGFAKDKPQPLGEADITVGTPFAAVYLTASEKDATIQNSKRLVLVTIARCYNDGMKYVRGSLLARGKAPFRMEPVLAKIRLQRPGTPTVHVLDHNGRRTGKTIPVQNGEFTVDGKETQTCYYEVSY